MIVLCSPGNPTGAVFAKDTLESALSLARRHGLYCLSDEIYAPIFFGGRGLNATGSAGDGNEMCQNKNITIPRHSSSVMECDSYDSRADLVCFPGQKNKIYL